MTNIKKELEVYRKNPITLKKVLEFVGVLPDEGIFLGLATDKMPVLFDVKYAQPNNIVIWDKLYKQGLKLLKVIAEYVFLHRGNASKVEFVVLTDNVEEWGELNKYGMGIGGNTSCIGIIPFESEIANTIVEGLCRWINENHKASKHPVIVLVDGLEHLKQVNKDFKINFRYLLLKGHNKNVYCIGTASKNNFAEVQDWLEGFKTEIYGKSVFELFEIIEKENKVIFLVPQTEMI
jgi:hypothetical protein